MKIQPLHDKIIVKPELKETMSPGGLYLPDPNDKRDKGRGKVVAVGPGKRATKTGALIPMSCKVGDTVIYSKYAGVDVTLEGEEHTIMSDDTVLAVVMPEFDEGQMAETANYGAM